MFRSTLAVGVVSAVLAAPAMAQVRPTYELTPITVTALSQSSRLDTRAVALYDQPARWAEAARLHRAAAESLPTNDVRSFYGFDRAARLFYYAGDFGSARSTMEKAVRVALATGDLVTAANASADVASIAIREGFPGKKRQYVTQARVLATSDLVGAADRSVILVRLDGAPLERQLAAAFLTAAE